MGKSTHNIYNAGLISPNLHQSSLVVLRMSALSLAFYGPPTSALWFGSDVSSGHLGSSWIRSTAWLRHHVAPWVQSASAACFGTGFPSSVPSWAFCAARAPTYGCHFDTRSVGRGFMGRERGLGRVGCGRWRVWCGRWYRG